MNTFPISENEICITRSPEALLNWCVEKFNEIGETEEGVTALRLGKGLCKLLAEEVYPLAVWGANSNYINQNAAITPVLGSQAYDAVIDDACHKPPNYRVEVTQAHMGQTEYFRMLHLEEKGWAPGPLSIIEKVDLDGTRDLRADRIAGSLSGYVEKTIQLVCEAVERKIPKAYEAPIILLVAFEDYIVRNEPEIREILHAAVTALVAGNGSPFSKIFLVGMLGHVLVEIGNES